MDLFADSEQPLLPFTIPSEIKSSWLWDEERKVFNILIPNGVLFYSRNFFSKDLSDRALEYFTENDTFDTNYQNWSEVSTEQLQNINFANINWKQDTINIYGKVSALPRLTAWYGDAGRSYNYSGINSNPSPWNKGLLHIKSLIENVTSAKFNSVLLNWYRSGEAHLGWHADNEKELGINPTIGSVNLGETRDFILRRDDDPSAKITIPLEHGSLLIMHGEMQHFWQHSVPKRKRIKGSRINLTFRLILDD